MKSAALKRQVQALFGLEGELALAQGLSRVAALDGSLESALRGLLEGADAACSQYAFVQQTLAELGGDVLSEWNLRTGIIESGRQWKSLLGYPSGALTDTVAAWQEQLHPDDVALVKAALAAHVRGQRPLFTAECRLRHCSGDWRWFSLRGKVSAREAQGQALRLLVLHRDISDVRATEAALLAAKEAAEAASRARGAFIANVSHEIRTPLNGVIGMTELALDTQLDSEQRHYLKTVKSSAESLLTLLNDILDFSKIEAGKMQFESIAFTPVAILQEAARTLAVSAHHKGLELVLAHTAQVPERVVGDPNRLRQVFLNLLGNAIKFTEKGEVVVHVDVERCTENSVYLRCSVRDTGIGIPQARQREIFDAFAQGDSSTTRRYGGTGLGLAICTRLVQLMDGSIGLASEAGKGSRFVFTARFGREPAEMAVRDECHGFLQGQRALLLEPNDSAAEALISGLAELGLAVTRVSDLDEAAHAMVRARELGYPYASFLVAASLGLACVEQWCQERPPEKLVLMLTHVHSLHGLERLQAQGLGGCLMKPVLPGDVLELLQVLRPDMAQASACLPAGSGGLDLAPIDLQELPAGFKELEVLLVEDNPVNQELARRLLEKHGHKVTVAQHGGEAVDYFERQRFDVIFMDMQMPVMGGVEATEAIRARELRRSWVVSGEFRQVPIIAMTANAMVGDRERCLEAGMNDYLTKPLRQDELLRVLAELQGDAAEAQLMPAQHAPLPALLDLEAAERDLGDRDLLLQMARMFLDEWPAHLAGLAAGLQGGSTQDLGRQAHTLKSLLAIFHAEEARRAALSLELACGIDAPNDGTQVQRLEADLRQAMAELKPRLEAFVTSA